MSIPPTTEPKQGHNKILICPLYQVHFRHASDGISWFDPAYICDNRPGWRNRTSFTFLIVAPRYPIRASESGRFTRSNISLSAIGSMSFAWRATNALWSTCPKCDCNAPRSPHTRFLPKSNWDEPRFDSWQVHPSPKGFIKPMG